MARDYRPTIRRPPPKHRSAPDRYALIRANSLNRNTYASTLPRIFGTVIGSIILIGLLFIIIALIARLGRYSWIYYAFMMPASAALNATTLNQVGALGEQRVNDNIVGGILVLLASAATIGYSTWPQRHGQTSDADPELEHLLQTTGAAPAAGAASTAAPTSD